MRANMRLVSSTDEIFFVRIASAASNAVAKSSSCAAGPDSFADLLELSFRGPAEESAFPDGTPSADEKGNAVAAIASGTVVRNSRRFIRGMVKGEARRRNPAIAFRFNCGQALKFQVGGAGLSGLR